MPRSVLRVGTRGSALALARAESVRRAISKVITHRNFELVPVVTSGDRVEGALPPERGLFAFDIQEALAAGKIDLAVHHASSLPATAPDSVLTAALMKREDPRDAIVSRTGGGLPSLPPGARIGITGPAQGAQLLSLGRGLVPEAMRGTLDNRLRALTDAKISGLVVPACSLRRLSRAERAIEVLPINVMLPEPAQGIMAVQCRSNDKQMRAALGQLDDANTRAAFEAERAFLLALGGDVDLPIAALAEADGERVRLRGLVASPDGKRVLMDQIEGDVAEKLGIELADRLRLAGAEGLLARA